MDINKNVESPMLLNISFNKLLEHYEDLSKSDDAFISGKAKRVLESAKPFPELRQGFSNTEILKDREKEIGVILQDAFAPILTKNEIKTASVPFHDLIFNSSQRFKNIIETAGQGFELNIKNMPDDHRYIIACTIILQFCYGYNLNFKRPFYYEIPDANDVLRYYKILYNADFCEILPGAGMHSYLLGNTENRKCSDALCSQSYNRLLREKKFFSVSDVDQKFLKAQGKAPHIVNLKKQGIKSAIFAPIANDAGLMGIIEIVSPTAQVLNSVNANKLIDIMPFIVSAVERSKSDEENLIEAIIQKECTSIHPSVHWRFAKEAKSFIKDEMEGKEPTFRKIAFNNIYPLYGQIDIKGSSEARNKATKEDLTLQLKAVKHILSTASQIENLPIYEQFIYQINAYQKGLTESFQVDSEQQISSFFKQDIEPLLKHLFHIEALKSNIQKYYDSIDDTVNVLYKHRKDYDDTIAKIILSICIT